MKRTDKSFEGPSEKKADSSINKLIFISFLYMARKRQLD